MRLPAAEWARRAKGLRQELEVEKLLAPPLREALATEALLFDEPLAIDPSRLVAVRLAVPGRELGKTLTYAVPGRRREGRHLYRMVGTALRVIERVGSGLPIPTSIPSVQHQVLDEVERSCMHLTDSERRKLEHVIARYTSEIEVQDSLVWGHGDMSSTNVLTTGHTVGIIDFSWSA